jgi:hypothetical protein
MYQFMGPPSTRRLKVLLYSFFGVIAAVVALGVWPSPAAPIGASNSGPALSTCGNAGVEFIGYSDALNKSAFGGFDVAELSGIAYDRHSGVYRAVADRAGSVSSHVFTLEVPLESNRLGTPRVTDVTVLNTDAGTPFTGANLDGEGIALLPDRRMIVASEGGSASGEQPEVRLFSPAGEHLESLPVPQRFQIGTNNLSFESLALNPHGHGAFLTPNRTSLFTVNEGPLSQDGRTADLRSRVRILRFKEQGRGVWSPAEEYFYQTEPGRTADDVGVVELVAVSEDRLLVMERGFVAGQGNTVRVFAVSLEDTADVSGEASLGAPGLVPLVKTLLFDLAQCPGSGAPVPAGATQPNPLLDNFEAMALGPTLPGGKQALLLVSDDNGSATQTTRVIALAVSRAALGW